MLNRISAIITARLTDSLFEAQERLLSLINSTPRDVFEIILIDYGTPHYRRHIFDDLVQLGIRVYRHPSPREIFSIGDARDYGVQVASAPVIMFLDLDFHASAEMFRSIHALAYEKKLHHLCADFFCVPVVFLTEEGTRCYLKSIKSSDPFLEPISAEKVEADRRNVAFPSYGSSAIVCNRQHYMAIGGHHDQFKGHGAEDFELLHRLASLAPWGPRPSDYYTDSRIKTLEPLSGFRPYFARYALAALDRGLFLVHRFHPPRPEPGYLRKRRNFNLLKKLMKKYDSNNSMPLPLVNLHSSESVLVVARTETPEFARARLVMSQFRAYYLLEESDPQLIDKIKTLTLKHRVDAALIGASFGLAFRTRLRMYFESSGLRIIIF